MALGINERGIVDARDRERITICRPHLNGGIPVDVEVPNEILEANRLETGDIVDGQTESIVSAREMSSAADSPSGNGSGGAHRRDIREIPSERLTTITRINGLDVQGAT